ncbi:MAG: hypothetical protein ABI778_01995 [Ignavibacteriota bacterium]
MVFVSIIYFSAALLISHSGVDSFIIRDTTRIKHAKHKMTITEVLSKHTTEWLKISGVLGTGEGRSEDKPCITIFCEHTSSAIRKKIPNQVDGYRVVFQTTGTIKAEENIQMKSNVK